ncbi:MULTISPECIES: heavy metal-associated domain-containing protein [Arcicella]|uniref:Heavy metal-associated domain-containing protein n=1 Tax=Arcicella aquatica TaxID=217141 RepID=A0ABU5QJK1_9BACT|nr:MULTISPECIES: heavy metal-associated domain-containing protein [Arcicella]MDR6560564.1 copper chaperone CopZ [Arcicella sp. BE51]MDR6809830.1 copper chaperone CopZ [Arcicella sp. BE140]MDR6821179.1 copper chaperone CopZ [Arcicella sp. BE139]MEA5256656.1 heavy metal-associated domain-containing protein [Arcicella aquatica]
MKKNILALILLLVSVLTFAETPKTETVKIKTSAICEMCKERIEKKLAFTKGVSESNLNIESKEKIVTVTYNPKKTSVEKIKKAIADVGYDADEVTANAKGYEKLPSCCKKGGM